MRADRDAEITKIFGRVLRRLREERGFSQETFAVVVPCNRVHVGNWERGTSAPTLGSLFRIADALQMKPSEFVEQMDKRRRR